MDESEQVTTLHLRDKLVHSVASIPPVQQDTSHDYCVARVNAKAAALKAVAMQVATKKPEGAKKKKRLAIHALEEEEEQEFLVANVTGSRVSAAGEPEYLIHWGGCDAADATWEPQANLANAQDKMSEFQARFAAPPRQHKRRRGALGCVVGLVQVTI